MDWFKLRKKVVSIYGKECMKCGISTETPHVDHILSKVHHPNLEYELDNLQVLCLKCNSAKGSNYPRDYKKDKTSNRSLTPIVNILKSIWPIK